MKWKRGDAFVVGRAVMDLGMMLVTQIQGWRGQPKGTGQDQPGQEFGAPASSRATLSLQECSSPAPASPKTSQLAAGSAEMSPTQRALTHSPRAPEILRLIPWKISKERQPGQGSNISISSPVLDLMEFLGNHPRSPRILW